MSVGLPPSEGSRATQPAPRSAGATHAHRDGHAQRCPTSNHYARWRPAPPPAPPHRPRSPPLVYYASLRLTTTPHCKYIYTLLCSAAPLPKLKHLPLTFTPKPFSLSSLLLRALSPAARPPLLRLCLYTPPAASWDPHSPSSPPSLLRRVPAPGYAERTASLLNSLPPCRGAEARRRGRSCTRRSLAPPTSSLPVLRRWPRPPR